MANYRHPSYTSDSSVPTYDRAMFTRTAAGGLVTLTCEASDLKARNGQDLRPARLYTDAADVGFAVRSTTGCVERFSLGAPVCDSDGDVQYWEAVPCNPRLAGQVVVRVYND